MAEVEPAKLALLTGAGLTKTFGGYLSSEMWARIFNQSEVQRFRNIRKKMLRNLNFESVYSQVVESRWYTPEEKRSFTRAVQSAYRSMHEHLLSENQQLIMDATAACKAVLSRFAGGAAKPGFIFTLNQDLFVERWFEDVDRSVIMMPGIDPGIRWFNPGSGPWIETPIKLPDKPQVEKIISDFPKNSKKLIYLKLHGSYAWQGSANHWDGDLMIIGRAKSDLIRKEPLLDWYFRVFNDALMSIQTLVVIGYSFGDKHINECILNNPTLMISVISPLEPRIFKTTLTKQIRKGKRLWNKIGSYYQGDITRLYHSATQELTRDGENYFANL